jgi:O-antigen/teichoic acid export membrane protein
MQRTAYQGPGALFNQLWRGSSRHVFDGGLMLLYRLSSSFAGIVIYAVSMRTYGPSMLGKYAYAATVTGMLAPLLISGVDPMLVRELVRRQADKLDLLGSAFALVLLTTLAAVGIPLLYVIATDYGDRELIYMVVGLSVGLLPNCVLVLMSLFRAESRITLATVCGLAGVLASAAVRVALVLSGKPLYFVTAAATLDPLISSVMLLAAYKRHCGSVFAWRVSRASLVQLFHLSWSAVLSSFIVTVFFRITHVMLKALSTYDQLGYYAVAFQMFTVLNFLPSSVLGVVYPRLVQLHQSNRPRYLDALRTLYVSVTVGGLVICVAVRVRCEEHACGPGGGHDGDCNAIHVQRRRAQPSHIHRAQADLPRVQRCAGADRADTTELSADSEGRGVRRSGVSGLRLFCFRRRHVVAIS